MAWGVTVPDTLADSHVSNIVTEARAAAKHDAMQKTSKYADLTTTYFFYPIAIETAGTCYIRAIELIEEIGRRTSRLLKTRR